MVKSRGIWTTNINEMSNSTFYRNQQHIFQSQTNERHLSTIDLNYAISENQQASNQQQQSIYNNIYNNHSQSPVYSEMKPKQKQSHFSEKKSTVASRKNENENEKDKIYRADSFLTI
jgi:hypothetical protein